jgi:hypothetical protein
MALTEVTGDPEELHRFSSVTPVNSVRDSFGSAGRMHIQSAEMVSEELKRNLGIDDDGTYRIDPQTGRVQKEGFFGWNDTEIRIDPDSGVVQEEGFFGYRDTATRVDPKTGIIQKEGFFGWADSDERIDPETGKHQVRGFFGWKDN